MKILYFTCKRKGPNMKNYTAKQYEMMENKLKNLANGEVFKLNKNDACPIEVTLNKRRGFKDSWRLQLIDAETDDTLITITGIEAIAYHKMVEGMLEMIEDWDRVTKGHFASLARKQGLDY